MLIVNRTTGKLAWIAAFLLAQPVISLAQQIAVSSGYPVPTPSAEPNGITAGPDGALWFTESYPDTSKIGRITTSGLITEYPAPTPQSDPWGITAGPDGALWFTEAVGHKIGRITTAGLINEYPIPNTVNSGPYGITAGPDGALWFTLSGSHSRIGRITTGGVITEYPTPTAHDDSEGITAGPDGALWFTEGGGNNIGRITTAGVITEYRIPTADSFPLGITAAPDGALWFTEETGNKIGRITTAGVITEYPIPTANSLPYGITTGPDGALWFTEYNANRIGRITTAGVITEYPLLTPLSGPAGITTGPDGELWLTEFFQTSGNTIGEVFFTTATLTVSPASGAYKTTLSFTGSGFAPNESVQIYKSGVGSTVLASATADSSGSFTVSGLVPRWRYGPRLFLGVGQTSGKLGAASFSISPLLSLKPTSGPVGSTVTAQGFGFGSFEKVNVRWLNPKTLLGPVTADVNGTWSGSAAKKFTVPSGAPPGVNKVGGFGEITKATALASFTVQ